MIPKGLQDLDPGGFRAALKVGGIAGLRGSCFSPAASVSSCPSSPRWRRSKHPGAEQRCCPHCRPQETVNQSQPLHRLLCSDFFGHETSLALFLLTTLIPSITCKSCPARLLDISEESVLQFEAHRGTESLCQEEPLLAPIPMPPSPERGQSCSLLSVLFSSHTILSLD